MEEEPYIKFYVDGNKFDLTYYFENERTGKVIKAEIRNIFYLGIPNWCYMMEQRWFTTDHFFELFDFWGEEFLYCSHFSGYYVGGFNPVLIDRQSIHRHSFTYISAGVFEYFMAFVKNICRESSIYCCYVSDVPDETIYWACEYSRYSGDYEWISWRRVYATRQYINYCNYCEFLGRERGALQIDKESYVYRRIKHF